MCLSVFLADMEGIEQCSEVVKQMVLLAGYLFSPVDIDCPCLSPRLDTHTHRQSQLQYGDWISEMNPG